MILRAGRDAAHLGLGMSGERLTSRSRALCDLPRQSWQMPGILVIKRGENEQMNRPIEIIVEYLNGGGLEPPRSHLGHSHEDRRIRFPKHIAFLSFPFEFVSDVYAMIFCAPVIQYRTHCSHLNDHLNEIVPVCFNSTTMVGLDSSSTFSLLVALGAVAVMRSDSDRGSLVSTLRVSKN